MIIKTYFMAVISFVFSSKIINGHDLGLKFQIAIQFIITLALPNFLQPRRSPDPQVSFFFGYSLWH